MKCGIIPVYAIKYYEFILVSANTGWGKLGLFLDKGRQLNYSSAQLILEHNQKDLIRISNLLKNKTLMCKISVL